MTARAPGEHRDPLEDSAVPLPEEQRPEAGPIAIQPFDNPVFADAIVAAGGSVGPLDQSTRGLVWLTNDPHALGAILTAHPGIGWVQLPLAGVNAFVGLLARHVGVAPIWTSAKGAFSEPVAEHALALTLAVLRGLPEKSRSTSWADPKTGISLYGRRVVVIGAGGIAVEIMRLFAPFETPFTIVRRTADALPGAERTVSSDRLIEVLPDADVVIVAAAATESTRHLLSTAEFAAMKPDAALVNIARGSLVDQDALVAALESGRLAGAGLDVTSPEPLPDEHPLWTAPRVVITSHSADTAEMVEPLLAIRIAANVRALHGDGAFVGVVDPAAGY